MAEQGTMPHYTEGVCGDGAAILRDGVPMTIPEILAALNEKQSPRLTDAQLTVIADRYENASRAIGGFKHQQWSVVRDLRMPPDVNDVLYRGHCHDTDAYRRALSVAKMRYALEVMG